MASTLLAQYRKALADAGVTDDTDDFFVIKDFLGPLAEQNRDLFKQDPELEQQWRAIREADSPGTVGGIVNTAKSAFDRSRQALNVIGGIGGDDATDISEYEQRIQSRPSSVPWEDWQRTTGGEAVKTFLRDPIEITSNIIASGFAGSVPALAGGLSGGAAGSLAGPVGGLVGAAAGTGAGSLAVEYGSKFLDVLREAGADIADPASIERVLSNPEVSARARDLGLRRGLPVAAFDAASAGLAGKFFKGLKGATAAQNVRAGLGEAVVQGSLGGGGEIAGALSSGERISPGAVFEEIVGEAGPAVVENIGALSRRRLADPYSAPEIAAVQPGPPTAINTAQGMAPSVVPLAPESIPEAAVTTARTNTDIVTSVEAMTPEQKVARATELAALPAPTVDQQTELELLRAEIPRAMAIQPVVVAGEATGPRSNFTTTGMVFPTEKAAIENAEPNQSVRRTAGGSYEVVDNTAPDVPPSSEVIDLPTAQLALPAAPPAPTRVINEEMPAPATQAGTVEFVANLGPAEFIQWTQTLPEGGMTGESYRVGIAAIGKPDEISVLKSALARVDTDVKAAEQVARAAPPETKATAIDAWSALGYKRQFFSEAIQAAENTGSAAEAPEVAAAHAPITSPAPGAEVLPNPIELPPVVPSAAEPLPTPAETMVATATPALPVPVDAALSLGRDRRQVEADIEAVGRELSGNVTAERKQELRNDSIRLFEELAQIETTTPETPRDISYRTTEQEASNMPAEAGRTQEFTTVIGRLQQLGMRIDIFARQFFAQGVRSEIEKQIAVLQQRQAAAVSPSEKASLSREITRRQARLGEVTQAKGAAFSPWHIKLAVDDVQNASSANLVTLLHEATEALGMRLNPVMKGRILRAIDNSIATLRQRATEASERTGVPLARETGPLDLLSETLAQELTAEGIPDAPNLAKAIWRWVKDIYFRTTMALQAAFGGEPSDARALDWFNNQLERVVGGDYDYRIARLLDRYAVAPMQEQVRRHKQPGGTPGGIADYYDPYLRRVTQPHVLPYTSDSVDWNVQFQSIPSQKTDLGESIPDPEARARIQAAAQNRLIEEAEKVRTASGTILPWADWWAIAGVGDDPRVVAATIEGKLPGAGTAQIGGERMTQYMNTQAGLFARALIENWQTEAQQRLAKANEAIESESDEVIAAAKLVNKIEGDRRNAEVHEAALQDKLKAMVRRFVGDNSKGYRLAEQKGELAEAVRQAEDLLDNEAIPDNYQAVFKSILDGQTPLFAYMRAIAELDLPLSDLSQREVIKAIRDNADTNATLGQLTRNRPLMVTLATLARRNAGEMDEIHLGWLRSGEQYRVISEELQEIRRASASGLREMIAGMDDRIKGATLRDRIVRDYLKRRRALQNARTRVATAQARADTISTALPAIGESVERAQQQGSEAPSEWTPSEGATFTEMRLGDDGRWSKHSRVLRFKPDGSAVESAAIESAISQNNLWIKANESRAGGSGYEQVKRETAQLAMRNMQALYPFVQSFKYTRFLGLLADDARKLGGRGGAELAQMFQAFEFIPSSHGQELQTKSGAWSLAFTRAMKAAGIKDIGIFRTSVYDPINYFLNTNPGLDEDAAIRQAVRVARARLTTDPAENFGEAITALLNSTKDISEFLIGIAEQQGSFVKDPRLKSELRRAVAQGWLTNMRSLNGAVVLSLSTDMEKAGWKLARKTEKDRNGNDRQTVVRATTFDDTTAADTTVANDATLRQRLQQLFAPSILRDWLEPFINKGGIEVFKNGEDAVPQLTLQNAWAVAKGDVLTWIDAVGSEVGLPAPEKTSTGTTDPVADFRLSMLKQLDSLFGMESELAAEYSQTRDLFDPMGPKPHVMMDARLDDKLPPEHLSFAIYDQHSAQMMLREIAFHSKFGRNGARLQQTLNQLHSEAQSGKADYERLKGTTKNARMAEAAARGQDYKELQRAAERYAAISEMKARIEQLFSIGKSGSVFEEAKIGMELMGFMSGQIVDNPKTGFYDILSLAERPFGQRSLGPASMKSTAKAFASSGKGALGTILEALNLHILHASTYYKIARQARGGSRNQPWAQAVADIGPGGRQGFTERVFVRPLRFLRYVQNKGVGTPIRPLAELITGDTSAQDEFARLAPFPGLGVNNTLGQIVGAGAASATAMELEGMIRSGADYFASHRDDLQNPSFRFEPKDLGFGRMDQGVFDWWRAKSEEYSMGILEDIVRAAIPRLAKGDDVVTKNQMLLVTQMTMQEFSGQTSLLTTPSFMQNNPFLRRALPLLRWPFWKMAQVGQGLTTIDGKRDYAALTRGLMTLAMWNLPIGLAFTFLLDKYDEDFMGKKSNLPPLGKTAALPFVGPVAEAIMSDRSIPDTLKAYAVRMGRAGNIGGVATDLIGQFASPTDAQSGRRVFSLDQRVLAMSQFLNAQQAISNFVHQDWTATWASVWAPLMRSLGGNGALHGLDIVNNVLGLDNAESRLVTRINANLWLRSSANELDIPLRGGGTSTPTPLSVWTRELLTAAMANDRIGFMESYRKALDAARKAVANDSTIPMADREHEAEKRVLAGWRGRDPLTVFAHRPTDIQMRQLFSIMDDTGRQEVQDALRRYQQFTRLIAPSQQDTQARSMERRLMRPPQMANPFRRETAGIY